MAIARSDITGLILAGGQGLRMGGADKGLVDCAGQPLVAHTLARLQAQVDHVIINANRHLERYAQLGWPVVADAAPGYAGPLAGLQAGLAGAHTDYVVTIPCDCPAFPPDLVARLAARMPPGAAGVVSVRNDARTEPAFALVAVALLPSLAAWLASGERKIDAWHAAMGAQYVEYTDASAAFRNLNTPDELASYVHTLATPST